MPFTVTNKTKRIVHREGDLRLADILSHEEVQCIENGSLIAVAVSDDHGSLVDLSARVYDGEEFILQHTI